MAYNQSGGHSSGHLAFGHAKYITYVKAIHRSGKLHAAARVKIGASPKLNCQMGIVVCRQARAQSKTSASGNKQNAIANL